MKYLFILVFFIVYIFFGKELGYAKGSPFYTHFVFMFQHAGIIHLTINSIAFFGIFRMTEKLINKYILALFSLSIVLVLSFFTAQDIPTVGASGMIYAMIGLYVGITAFDKNSKIFEPKKYAIFLTTVVIALTISSIGKTSNHLLHSLSFLTGVFSHIVVKNFKVQS